MKTNQNSKKNALMGTFNRQRKVLEINTSELNKIRKINQKSKPPSKPHSNIFESDSENEEVEFIVKLSGIALPIGYMIDFLFVKPVAEYFSFQYEGETAKELIRLSIPAAIIGIDILIGSAIIKAREFFESTGAKRIQLVLWKTAGIIFLGMIPMVVFSTILVSYEFSTGHILLYCALTILSVISHVVLIFNPNFHQALKYFLNLFYQWIKRGRQRGIETEISSNQNRQITLENKFKENYNNLLNTKELLKEHTVEIILNGRLSDKTLELVGEFYPKNKDHKEGDNSIVIPFSKTGS